MPASGGSRTFQFTAFRHAAPAHAEIGSALLEASRRVGGRFNPPGEFGALYLSMDRATVRAELRRRAERTGVEPDELLPRACMAVEVDVGRVLDLTDESERTRWGLDLTALAGDEHTLCQEVGRAARREGYEAILYPSAARASGLNVVVFTDRLHPGSRVQVVSREELELDL